LVSDLRLSGIGMTSARTRDRLVQRLREQGVANLAVLDRIRNVPRHIFVDEALGSRAYEDTALPIGFGQTISQPYIVARMTEALLESGANDNVLEVGTGCGYQTAVLAPLVARLQTIERIGPLLARARLRLKELGIRNVRFRHGDGTLGWKAHAPFDAILVGARGADQTTEGGRAAAGTDWPRRPAGARQIYPTRAACGARVTGECRVRAFAGRYSLRSHLDYICKYLIMKLVLQRFFKIAAK
jgi:protein-L-isoaspartate(D-aspartate) O-methyltransferase